MGLTYADLQIMGSLYVGAFYCLFQLLKGELWSQFFFYVLLKYIPYIEQSQSRENGAFDDVSEARSRLEVYTIAAGHIHKSESRCRR